MPDLPDAAENRATPRDVVTNRPLLVAHRGGNSRVALRSALAAGVDWLEVDVWWHYGRVVARHDPAVWRLPLTYHRRRVALAMHRPLTLDRLLDAVDGSRVRLLLDLKGTDQRLPAALVETLRRRDALERAALCTQDWGPLDVAYHLEPRLARCFSLGRPEHLEAFARRLADGTAPHWISINHRLLTAERVAAFCDQSVTLIAWTVNDLGRARELAGWGVHGITSDSLALLRGLRCAAG